MKKSSLFLVVAASTCIVQADNKHVSWFSEIKQEVTEEAHNLLSETEQKWNDVIEWLEGAKKHAVTIKAAHGPAILHDETAEKAAKENTVKSAPMHTYKKHADEAKDTAEDALNKAHRDAKELHDTLKDHAEKVQKELKNTSTEHNKVLEQLSKAKPEKKKEPKQKSKAPKKEAKPKKEKTPKAKK